MLKNQFGDAPDRSPLIAGGEVIMRIARLLSSLIAVLAVTMAAPAPARVAAQAAQAVGVVDFYSPGTLQTIPGVTPELFAADEMTGMLANASGGHFTVIPRRTMQQAQGQLRWSNWDVLSFQRLQALGHAVNADHLIVGWIPLLVISEGGGKTMPPDSGGPPEATANLVVQVFSVAEGRILTETRGSGFALGATSNLLAEWSLQRALQPTVAPVLAALTSSAP
jgi:hypothetical protein